MRVVDRIQVYTGSFSGYLYELAQILSDSVREVVADIPPDAQTERWEELVDPDGKTGVETSTYKILEVRKGLQRAVEISPSVRDTTRAGVHRPFYYTMGGRTYVLPTGGTIMAVGYPAITLNDESVDSVPDELLHLVCLKAASGGITFQIMQIQLMQGGEILLPTSPAAPALIAPKYDDATATDPVIVDWTLLQVPPVPTYPKPAFDGDITAMPTLPALDLTKDVEGLPNLAPSVPLAPALSTKGLTPPVIEAPPDAPEYEPFEPTTPLEVDRTDYTMAAITEEDEELAKIRLAELSTQLNEWELRIREKQTAYESKLALWRSDLEIATANARLLLEGERADVVQTDLMLLQQYVQILAHFQSEMAAWGQKAQAVTEEWTSEFRRLFETWLSQQQAFLSLYSTDIQSAKVEYDGLMTHFRSEVERILAEASTLRDEARQVAQQSTEVSVVNAAKNFEATVSAFMGELQRYQTEAGVYASITGALVSKQDSDDRSRAMKMRSLERMAQRVAIQYEDRKRSYMKYFMHRRPRQIVLHEF